MENGSDKAELLEILRARAATYTFLSSMYRQEIAADELAQLVHGLNRSGVEQGAAGEGYGVLQQFAGGVQEAQSLDAIVSALAAEYTRLFYVDHPDDVFLYESVYTSKDHLVMQEARDQVVRLYRQEGLDKEHSFREPEDHIALELEFMAHLCVKAAEALDKDPEATRAYLEKQRDFLTDHLLVWVPKFSQDLARATRSDFYRGVALITQEHLALELETVDELLAAVA
jgi:TorA maturation chaperone TorD